MNPRPSNSAEDHSRRKALFSTAELIARVARTTRMRR
jgi:hypothetical protein